jgi:hypothetical protein
MHQIRLSILFREKSDTLQFITLCKGATHFLIPYDKLIKFHVPILQDKISYDYVVGAIDN